MQYPFDTLFLVCNGPRCNNPDRGDERGEPIQKALKAHNKAMGRKPTVRVCSVSCLDLCDHGPNMIVDGTVYSHLSRELARAVYEGVMGGGETEISSATRNVLLESANFAPLSIRKTSRELGLATGASYRFERGADIEMAHMACDRAAVAATREQLAECRFHRSYPCVCL